MNRKAFLSVLWFVAAALAFTAWGISFSRGKGTNYAVMSSGLFCLVMGIVSLRRPHGDR